MNWESLDRNEHGEYARVCVGGWVGWGWGSGPLPSGFNPLTPLIFKIQIFCPRPRPSDHRPPPIFRSRPLTPGPPSPLSSPTARQCPACKSMNISYRCSTDVKMMNTRCLALVKASDPASRVSGGYVFYCMHHQAPMSYLAWSIVAVRKRTMCCWHSPLKRENCHFNFHHGLHWKLSFWW